MEKIIYAFTLHLFAKSLIGKSSHASIKVPVFGLKVNKEKQNISDISLSQKLEEGFNPSKKPDKIIPLALL